MVDVGSRMVVQEHLAQAFVIAASLCLAIVGLSNHHLRESELDVLTKTKTFRLINTSFATKKFVHTNIKEGKKS